MEGVSEIMGGLTSFRCGNRGVMSFKGFAKSTGHKSSASFKQETITFKNTDKDQPVEVNPTWNQQFIIQEKVE